MTTEAFDIWTDVNVADRAGGRRKLPAGWADQAGPGIDARTWPRSPRTGQPMLHCFTLWLPEAYRRRGPDLVAVSVFQWEDELYFEDPSPQVAAAVAGRPVDVAQPEHPFWAELAKARPHPRLQIADDGVASLFAMVWLTEAEFNGARVARPAAAKSLADGEVDNTSWRLRHGQYGALWLVPRKDPNVGVPPVRFPSDGDAYVDVPDRYDVFHDEHLGGTGMSPDGVRDGLSPWYIEVCRLGGISFGGDMDIALDLENPAFLGDWSTAVTISGTFDR